MRWAWTSRPLSQRLRVIGTVVLVAGLTGAWGLYTVRMRALGPSVDDLLPGYSSARNRQVGILIGSLGVTLLGWLDALKTPALQAELMAGASVVAAVICFRIARLADTSGSDPHR